MNQSLISEQVRQIAAQAAADENLELVHVEFVGAKSRNPTVRIFIDKAEGVTLDDCASVSRRVGMILDERETIPAGYLLEVSSPGIERGLYNLQDFAKFSGQKAKVKTHKAVGGQKNFRGTIIKVDGDEIVFDDRTNGTVKFPFESVAKANLEVDFEEELKGNK